MRLTGFYIDGFGIFHDVLVKDIPPGVVLFLGENEAGKTTLLAFLRAVFFGFPGKKSKEKPYPPLKGGVHGGRVFLHHDHLGEIVVERRPGKGGGILTANVVSSGHKMDPNDLLGGITPELFKNVYAFSLNELQSFKDLDNDAVRAAIYGASIGSGMSSLPKALKDLSGRKEALFKPRGRDQEINRRLGELEDKRAELKELVDASRCFGDKNEALKAKEAGLSGLNDKLSRLKDQRSRIETYKRLWPDWLRLKKLKAELADLPAVPDDFPKDGLTGLDNLLKRREEEIKRAEACLMEYSDICAEIEGLRVNEAVILNRDAIQQVLSKRELYLHTKEELTKAHIQAETKASEIEQIKKTMAAEGWEGIGREAMLARKEAAATLSRYLSELMDCSRGLDFLKDALEDRGKTIDGLKMAIDGRKGSIRRKRLVFFGINWFLTTFFLFCSILSISAAHYVEGGIWAAIAGLLAIFGLLARGRLNKDNSLKEMEAHLVELEEDAAKKTAEQDLLNRRKMGLEKEIERLKAEAGLSDEEVTQERLQEVLSGMEMAVSAYNNLKEAGDRLERLNNAIREGEEAARRYHSEINAVFETLGRQLGQDERILATLDALGDELRLSSDNLIKRREKERQGVRACEEFSALENELCLLAGELAALIKMGGAKDKEEFRRLCGIHQKKNDIVREMNVLEMGLKKVSGEDIGMLGQVFEGMGLAQLDIEHKRLTEEIGALEKEIAHENQAIGALKREIDDILSSEERIAMLMAEEERLIAEIGLLSRKWAGLSVADFLIRETKKEIETVQQPKVLRDSGRFLKTITGGAYDRVIIPLEGGAIKVVGRDGAMKGPEALSRGTAEQLFLALRLGYILNCAEKGMVLPLIMDDILVNFDPARAANTASAIMDVAKTHQVLFFTCHPETVAVFKECKPDVKVYGLNSGRIEASI